MKTILNILIIYLFSLLTTSCSRADYSGEKIVSPSGKYYFITSVNKTDKSKDDYAYVVISLFDVDGKLITKLNTNAGDFSKWAIGWDAKTDTIIMNSSDIGTYAWKPENNHLKEIELTESIKEQSEEIKNEKYK